MASNGSDRWIGGLAILAGLAAGGYVVYQLYKRERAKEMSSAKPPRFVEVEVPPISKRK